MHLDDNNNNSFKSIEKTLGITNNVIIVGDINEAILGPIVHNLNYILRLNSLNDITSQPTRLDAPLRSCHFLTTTLYFIKIDSLFFYYPSSFTTLPLGEAQWHFTDTEKNYFTYISTVNAYNPVLFPFHKLTNNSLQQKRD